MYTRVHYGRVFEDACALGGIPVLSPDPFEADLRDWQAHDLDGGGRLQLQATAAMKKLALNTLLTSYEVTRLYLSGQSSDLATKIATATLDSRWAISRFLGSKTVWRALEEAEAAGEGKIDYILDLTGEPEKELASVPRLTMGLAMARRLFGFLDAQHPNLDESHWVYDDEAQVYLKITRRTRSDEDLKADLDGYNPALVDAAIA